MPLIIKDLINLSKMLSYYGNINNNYFYTLEKKLKQYDRKNDNIPFSYKINNNLIQICCHHHLLIILKILELVCRIR